MPTGNFFINSTQINTVNVNVIIPEVQIKQSFSNAEYGVPGMFSGVMFPVSGENDSFDLTIVLRNIGSNQYSAIKTAEKTIYTEFQRQVSERIPIRIRHTNTEFYLDHKDIFVFIEGADYSRRGSNGKNHLELKFQCRLYGISNTDGGNVDPDDPWTSGGIASFMIGS